MSVIIPKNVQNVLERQHYGVIGKHSAVQICRWTKKSLLDKGYCYKQQFYGISSHRCCQMSPCVMWCQNKCLHCWRATELTLGTKINKSEADKPKAVIKGCIEEQRKLLTGFKGNPNVNRKKFDEAQEPSQFAISLSGEPTIYPFIGELIKELKRQKKTSFLVTNGLSPRVLLKLQKNDQLPTQLYLSLNAPNKALYQKFTRPVIKDAWQKFNHAIKIFPGLDTRKVIRMTLVKDLNMLQPENYAKMINKAKPDFVEVKGFMSVGFSRQRLGYERMPIHDEVRDFAEKISKMARMPILDEKIESRVILLGKNKENLKIKL